MRLCGAFLLFAGFLIERHSGGAMEVSRRRCVGSSHFRSIGCLLCSLSASERRFSEDEERFNLEGSTSRHCQRGQPSLLRRLSGLFGIVLTPPARQICDVRQKTMPEELKPENAKPADSPASEPPAKPKGRSPQEYAVWATLASKLLEASAPVSASLVTELLRSRTNKKDELVDVDFEVVDEPKRTFEQEKAAMVKDLMKSGIDPSIFDALLSNEINRRLKVRFGSFFLAITFFFTAASYVIVVLNSVYQWKIPDVAIISLIIQAPIQLIGLLFIIARNLFPNSDPTNGPKEKKG